MDDRFKNLNRPRHHRLAVLLLIIVCGLMLVCNRFVYSLLGFPASEFQRYLSYSATGVVLAQFPLLAVWTVLSNQSFLRRMQFLVFSSVTLVAAWMLGFVSRIESNTGINWANRETVYYLGCLPLMLLASALPLIGLRFFFSRVLVSICEKEIPTRQPVTTAGLMITTAVIAFVLAAARLPALLDVNQPLLFVTQGFFTGMFFLAGLLITLPSVLILCSPRLNIWFWLPVIFGFSTLLVAGFIAFTSLDNPAAIEEILVPIQGFVTAMALVLSGIAVIRLFGYRIRKSAPASQRR